MKWTMTVLALMIAASCADAAPDANIYSYKVWPRGSLATGEISTAKTPFGKITCAGGSGYSIRTGQRNGPSSPRHCHW